MTTSVTGNGAVYESPGQAEEALDIGWRHAVLARKRQAIIALSVFSGAFFAVGLGLTLLQALRYGYGFSDGRLREADRIAVDGTGMLGDSSIILLTLALNLGLMLAWSWIGQRVGDDRNEDPVASSPPTGSWYLVEIPKTTNVLLGVAVICVVAIVVTAVLLFPLILVRYGW